MTDDQDDPVLAGIVDELAGQGWSVSERFVEASIWQDLARECRLLEKSGAFRPAGVGMGGGLSVRQEIRSDSIHWLDPEGQSPAQRQCLARLEVLRQRVNRELFLGLHEFEGHLAVYPPGSFYRRHLDQFHGVERRQLTIILYLNEDWQTDHGGQLQIELDEAGNILRVEPLGGRLVTFLSARFYHEVLPARRERLSLTGWFKRRL